MLRFKAVLFDLDDTLVDRKSAYEYAYRKFYEQQPAIKKHSSWLEALEFFWSLSPDNATDARTAIVEIMRRWPGVKSDRESYRKFYFETLIEGLKPLAGVPEFLRQLNRAGVKWGVVTNGDAYQVQKLNKTGLQELVPFMVVSKIFGHEKPAPEIYHEAARQLGINGAPYSEVLFVGDNPYTDIAGAAGVGMKSAWVKMGRTYAYDAPRPDIAIDSVTELGGALGA